MYVNIEKIIAIDPGPIESALIEWDGVSIKEIRLEENDHIRLYLKNHDTTVRLVIEKVACMGMAVGDSVFETVYWSGIFAQAFGVYYTERIKRHEVKMHLCGNTRARDANIRQALIDRFGAPGTKKNPGLTYGLSKDLWQAFAIGVTFWDKQVENLKGR